MATFNLPGILVKEIEITAAPTGSEQDTGFDLPQNCIVFDVFVKSRVAEATGATKTIDVGLLSSETAGDADGFLKAIDVSATGLKGGVATYTDGASQNYVSANTIGALLFDGLVGSNAAGEAGTINRTPHLVTGSNAKSVTYTAGSNDWVEFRGSIIVVYAPVSA